LRAQIPPFPVRSQTASSRFCTRLQGPQKIREQTRVPDIYVCTIYLVQLCTAIWRLLCGAQKGVLEQHTHTPLLSRALIFLMKYPSIACPQPPQPTLAIPLQALRTDIARWRRSQLDMDVCVSRMCGCTVPLNKSPSPPSKRARGSTLTKMHISATALVSLYLPHTFR
jgi:hypothetical protein